LRHQTEENNNLRHPVANPYQLALRFDDSLKMHFNDILKERICSRHPRVSWHPGWEPLV